MTAQTEQCARHRRKVTERRAVIAAVSALGVTRAAVVTTTSLLRAENFGRLVRSCGNCSTQYQRSVIINDVDVTAPGKSIVGINSNHGDTAAPRKVPVRGDSRKKIKTCARFQSTGSGTEPTELGSGADGTNCRFSSLDLTCG